MTVTVPVHALHTCEEYWGENGHEFTPERFVENPSLEKAPFYLPFGAGPRNCIAMRFALMQGRMAIGFLVKNFEISFVPDFVDDVAFEFKNVFSDLSKPVPLILEPIDHLK